MKNYAELDLALTVNDLHDPEEDNVLVGVSIPSRFRNAFLRDIERLAVTKYCGATFEELLDEDREDASLDAAIRTSIREEALRNEGPIDAEFEVVSTKQKALLLA